MILILRRLRGGPDEGFMGGASIETFSGEAQLKKPPCMNTSSINLTNCFRMREHFDTIFFSFSYRLMLGATWLCLCFLMGNRVIGEEEVEMIPSGCCDWPSCYDTRTQVCHLTLIFLMIPLFKLCLDACQKVWIQCPSKLVLLSCYSRFLPKDFNRYNV